MKPVRLESCPSPLELRLLDSHSATLARSRTLAAPRRPRRPVRQPIKRTRTTPASEPPPCRPVVGPSSFSDRSVLPSCPPPRSGIGAQSAWSSAWFGTQSPLILSIPWLEVLRPKLNVEGSSPLARSNSERSGTGAGFRTQRCRRARPVRGAQPGIVLFTRKASSITSLRSCMPANSTS